MDLMSLGNAIAFANVRTQSIDPSDEVGGILTRIGSGLTNMDVDSARVAKDFAGGLIGMRGSARANREIVKTARRFTTSVQDRRIRWDDIGTPYTIDESKRLSRFPEMAREDAILAARARSQKQIRRRCVGL